MGDFKQSRARGLEYTDFVLDLEELNQASEGRLLDAFELIFDMLCDAEVHPEDEPLAITAAMLIVDRLRDLRNSGLGSKVNSMNRWIGNWGNTSDITINA